MKHLVGLLIRTKDWCKNNKPLALILVGFVLFVYLFNVPIMKSIESVYLGDNYKEAQIDKKLSQPKYKAKIDHASKMKADVEKMTHSIDNDTTQKEYNKSFSEISDMRSQKSSEYDSFYRENEAYLKDSNLPKSLKYN